MDTKNREARKPSMLEAFRRQLLASSISLDRAGRYSVTILSDNRLSDVDKKEQIVDLYMSKGSSKEKAEEMYNHIIDRLSKFKVHYGSVMDIPK